MLFPARGTPGAQGFQFCKALKHMLSTRTSTSSTCSCSLDLAEISTGSWKGPGEVSAGPGWELVSTALQSWRHNWPRPSNSACAQVTCSN